MLVGAPGIPGAHYWCSPTHQPTFGGTPRQSSPKKREMPPMAEGPHLPYPPERRGHWWAQLVALGVIGTSFLDLFWGAPPGSEETVCQSVASRAPPQPYAHTCCALLPSPCSSQARPQKWAPTPHLHPPHLKPLQLGRARAAGSWLIGCQAEVQEEQSHPLRPPSWWPCWSHADTCSCTCPLDGPQLPGPMHGAQELECSPR